MKRTISWGMLFLLLAVAISDSAYQYPLLPERMATHFGPSGRADGWMAKDSFFWFMGILTVFVTGMCLLPGVLLRYLPAETINMPRKDYWLAPERREATLAVISGYFVSMSSATLALLVAIMHLTYRANLLPEPRLGSEAWLLLVAYLVFTGVWSVSFLRRFGKKEG